MQDLNLVLPSCSSLRLKTHFVPMMFLPFSIASFLFTTFSIYISKASPDRIASNIVTGIGFLGAGVIFKSDNRVNGITTAATIWAVAAMGMGIGMGQYVLVLVSTMLVLGALLLLTKLEGVIDRMNRSHNYRIVSDYREDLLNRYEQIMEECHLSYTRIRRQKLHGHIIGYWIVQGSAKNHDEFTRIIMGHPEVKAFEF